jgi:EcsC protein family
MDLSKVDLEDLRYARSLLENPGLTAKITSLIGIPIEKALGLLPRKASALINAATKKSLEKALHFALVTMDDRPRLDSRNTIHKLAVAATGAGGGAFGLPALTVELPVSTLIILRSIADIARSEGERIKTPEAKFACLEVFAMGGRSKDDDASESAYFAVRAALARTVSEAAKHIAKKGLTQEGAPAIVRFLTRVATQFEVAVSEKVAAQAVPLIGAAGGALVNTLFIDHFQTMARGHFIVRKLERTYGSECVKKEYLNL